MGDSGSLLLGFSLATLTLSQEGVRGSRADVLSVIAAPVFVLLIPIFDTTLVTVAAPAVGPLAGRGGRDHSSHRLVAIGTLRAQGGARAVVARRGRRRDRHCSSAGRRMVDHGGGLFLLRWACSPSTWRARSTTIPRGHAASGA